MAKLGLAPMDEDPPHVNINISSPGEQNIHTVIHTYAIHQI